MVLKYNDFYISRYEAGNDNETVVNKQNSTVYVNETQTSFKEKGKSMYDNSNVKSAMCSGIQWDMAMKFIDGKKSATDSVFEVKTYNPDRHRDEVEKSGKNLADKVQNIYDLEGNCYEYVAKKNTIQPKGPFVKRGGGYKNNDSSSIRSSSGDVKLNYITSRIVMYVM